MEKILQTTMELAKTLIGFWKGLCEIDAPILDIGTYIAIAGIAIALIKKMLKR